VAPFGSGNDFAKVLGMPVRPDEIARSILRSDVHVVDMGTVRVTGDEGSKEARFINAVGIGFDALVASRTRSSRKVRGVAGYLYLALRTLLEWDYPEIEVIVNGDTLSTGPSLLATAGNGTCSGGGFYLTPRASPSDGRLDLCVVRRPTAVGIVQLVPALLRGRHLEHPAVSYLQISEASIRSSSALFVHVDGEVVTGSAREVEIAVLPSALRVRAPGLQ